MVKAVTKFQKTLLHIILAVFIGMGMVFLVLRHLSQQQNYWIELTIWVGLLIGNLVRGQRNPMLPWMQRIGLPVLCSLQVVLLVSRLF